VQGLTIQKVSKAPSLTGLSLVENLYIRPFHEM
jgi:hypothetical protein